MPASFLNGSYGLMVHYLATSVGGHAADDMTSRLWNDRVESFDVEGFCDQLEEAKAGHLIFTAGQNSGYYATPSESYDAFTPGRESRCSGRDLVGEIALACRKRGISFICYLPCHPASSDIAVLSAMARLDGESSDRVIDEVFLRRLHNAQGAEDALYLSRRKQMQIAWEGVITEWSERWGDTVSGWWIDGCYLRGLFQSTEAPNALSFAAACRAGNPHAAVSMAKGHHSALDECYPGEDFTAGECIERLWVGGWFGQSGFRRLPSRLGQDVQVHILHFLSDFWGRGEGADLPDALIRAYTQYVCEQGAGMTWDVPIQHDGRFGDKLMNLLKIARPMPLPYLPM
jgi:hypothetical protein